MVAKRTLRLLNPHNRKDCRRDIRKTSDSLLILGESKSFGLLSGHDEGNRVGGVSGVRVSSLGVQHLLGAGWERKRAWVGLGGGKREGKGGREEKKKSAKRNENEPTRSRERKKKEREGSGTHFP